MSQQQRIEDAIIVLSKVEYKGGYVSISDMEKAIALEQQARRAALEILHG